MTDIDAQIEQLECRMKKAYGYEVVPGTIIQRVLLSNPDRIGWSISLGRLKEATLAFCGDSIEDCIRQALELFERDKLQ